MGMGLLATEAGQRESGIAFHRDFRGPAPQLVFVLDSDYKKALELIRRSPRVVRTTTWKWCKSTPRNKGPEVLILFRDPGREATVMKRSPQAMRYCPAIHSREARLRVH